MWPAAAAQRRPAAPGHITPRSGPITPRSRRLLARIRAAAPALLAAPALAATAIALVGCGGHTPRAAALRIERADFVLVAHALQRLENPVNSEVTAARAVWPALAGGLPSDVSPTIRSQIASAHAHARAIRLPRFFDTEGALTGPATGISALMKSYVRLTQRGWQVTTAAAAVGDAPRANPAASFLLANSGLYIYSIYDGHYDVSLVGKALTNAYDKLGGARAFGGALTQGEVEALALSYSIAGMRLVPHPSPQVRV